MPSGCLRVPRRRPACESASPAQRAARSASVRSASAQTYASTPVANTIISSSRSPWRSRSNSASQRDAARPISQPTAAPPASAQENVSVREPRRTPPAAVRPIRASTNTTTGAAIALVMAPSDARANGTSSCSPSPVACASAASTASVGARTTANSTACSRLILKMRYAAPADSSAAETVVSEASCSGARHGAHSSGARRRRPAQNRHINRAASLTD